MKNIYKNIIPVFATLILVVVSSFFFFRVDLTSDKRYSIAPQTKLLMQRVTEPMEVTVYLNGNLNPGFLRLRNATVELLEELAIYANRNITIRYEDVSLIESVGKRQEKFAELQAKGLTPAMLNERDKDGKIVQSIIFPWIVLSYNNRTLPVNLIKDVYGVSREESLNISIENLEFEVTDAIRQLILNDVRKIAFIEGHGELSEDDTFDISKTLSKYFQVDRGVLGDDASVLNPYKAIIIAKPTAPFSESDKYIIDQYIMNGGKVLWLVEGVKIAREELSATGVSPAIEMDLNLNDMFFRYGVRINPVLLQDVQSVNIPVNVAPAGESPQFEPMPWFYAPLLLTSYAHPVTRNIAEVKADFCSAVELVGENAGLSANLLLATSDNTHVVRTPATIDLNDLADVNEPDYFNMGYIPVAVSLEGVFSSAFANRMQPRGVGNLLPQRSQSVATKQIIVADGDIIRNEIAGNEIIPLGFDRYMNRQFGNKDFICNSVLYLTDEDGWMNLRSRTVTLGLLNKQLIKSKSTVIQTLNIVLPIVVLLVFGFVYQLIRKRKYT
ncbi:gliding motility-associated ABC transporter substrate-binding protein GldG [Paludibacter sp. 221]|uniref:gliding motility-associated ABC transporter substrate-binding protein GldG n=1 Tax=Paludibacter sp. 221 TaxID=2302939 RepID=UPI0013CF920D